ncbi:MAG: cyclomaltodextrinase N-terminal domain-containing protein [Acidobacteria bacterium]|nr:cyclomaltodextrinase N-terminal domain-containing protein [Acidobacteriota bacterium]
MNRAAVGIFQILSAVFLLACSVIAQNAPQISKVEPPNWWAGHSINPVRVMARGANLQNASVQSKNNALKVSNVKINGRGDYLFFDVKIAVSAKVGKYEFQVSTPKGKSIVPFEISEPLDAKTHFQGVTNDDVIYLIMPDRFANGDTSNDNPKDSSAAANDRKNSRAWHGGDFRGIKKHLDYLKELGITAIWLTPWYDNPNRQFDCDKPWCPNTNYHGYHAIDYYAAEDRFGTLADLRDLIEAAHKIGIKVVQDQVANHVGVQHVWVKNPPLDNWFSRFEPNTFNNSVLLSPNASETERNNLLRGWFNESLPDLNQDEPEVSRYEIQNALWWIGTTGIDGVRQDTIQYMPRPFIRDWSTAILKQYPRIYLVGEVFETDSAQTAFFQGGKTGWDGVDTKLPSVFDFNLWNVSRDVFTGKKPARALRDVLKYDGLYPNVNNITTLQNNHDTKRFMSLDGATLEAAMLHTAFLLSTRGIPQLYYGEELAMRGGDDPFNRADFPGGWAEDKKNAFTKSGRTAEEQEMFSHIQTWLEIRRQSNALKFGRIVDLQYNEDVYSFARQSGKEIVVLGFNRSNEQKYVEFDEGNLGLKNVRYLPNGSGIAINISNQSVVGGKAKLPIPPRSAVIYQVVEKK